MWSSKHIEGAPFQRVIPLLIYADLATDCKRGFRNRVGGTFSAPSLARWKSYALKGEGTVAVCPISLPR